MREHWLHKTPNAFLGYAIQQATRYGLKGARYKELRNFMLVLDSALSYETIIELANYKHIEMVMAPGPRGAKTLEDIPYLSVLGKKFDITLDREYIIERLTILKDSYGKRTKAASEGNDWKALSHAIRVVIEVFELLQDQHITFPLKSAAYIKQIKQGNVSLESILEVLEMHITNIDTVVSSSTLPESIDKEQVNRFLLKVYNNE